MLKKDKNRGGEINPSNNTFVHIKYHFLLNMDCYIVFYNEDVVNY